MSGACRRKYWLPENLNGFKLGIIQETAAHKDNVLQ